MVCWKRNRVGYENTYDETLKERTNDESDSSLSRQTEFDAFGRDTDAKSDGYSWWAWYTSEGLEGGVDGTNSDRQLLGGTNVATDYILFLHGVNVREFPDGPDDANFPKYANPLFERIQNSLKGAGTVYNLEKIAIYYGDLNMQEEQTLVDLYQRSPDWKNFWFRHARENFLLQIIGDIALYISPTVSAHIVARLHQALKRLPRDLREGGRLHLVSHSLGTIILFDILFASRWDNKDVPGYDTIMQLRETLYGLGDHCTESIHIASIHTMGSPIALFSLLNMHRHAMQQETGPDTMMDHAHDIGPRLQQFLQHLSRDRKGKPLPWWNFAHPGDPLASPLAQIVPHLVDQERCYLNVHDMITSSHDLQDWLITRFRQSPAALIHSKAAHHSYWDSQKVASRIAQTIKDEEAGHAALS